MLIQYCAKVVLNDVKFTNNLAEYGGITILADRRFMISIDANDVNTWSQIPNEIAVMLTKVEFDKLWVNTGYAIQLNSGMTQDG